MPDILDTAENAGGFKTLLEAVSAAGLEDTLRGRGPFTVFAPNDDAFGKIPPADLRNLLRDQTKLRNILNYHVVPGKMMAADVAKATTARTAQGGSLNISAKGGVRVNDAHVVKTDIAADNGVIHVIDKVLMPK